MIACVKEYKRRFGVYPKAVLADKIYQTKNVTIQSPRQIHKNLYYYTN